MKPVKAIVNGYAVSGFLYASPTCKPALPLLVALHGGTYTHEYFKVSGSGAGSFIDIANQNGFDVLAIDRSGYGLSEFIPDAENTFALQASLIDGAIAEFIAQTRAQEVVLIGHSIGGIISLEIAARNPSWNLIGVSATGMGAAHNSKGGAAGAVSNMPSEGMVDLPLPAREALWYGPSSGYTRAAVEAGRLSYAPAPVAELANAPKWAGARLDAVAAKITCPLHNAVGEYDAIWDSSSDARSLFTSKFKAAAQIESEVVLGVGHCIDHHVAGSSIHLKQLSFASKSSWLKKLSTA